MDYVDDHVVNEAALLERLGNGVAFADRLVNARVLAFADGVGASLADDAQGFKDGHAGTDQGAEWPPRAADDGSFRNVAEDRVPAPAPIQAIAAYAAQACDCGQWP